MRYRIRPSRPADAALLGAVEAGAAQRFGDIGLTVIAEGRLRNAAEYRALAAAGRLWVGELQEGRAVGLAIAGTVDGEGYLAEVSVHPDHGRRGLGKALVETVETWALAQGYRRLFLTTYRDVPWNRPLYERLGFAIAEEPDLASELRAIRSGEWARGLDRLSPRVAMVKVLSLVRVAGGPRGARPSRN